MWSRTQQAQYFLICSLLAAPIWCDGQSQLASWKNQGKFDEIEQQQELQNSQIGRWMRNLASAVPTPAPAPFVEDPDLTYCGNDTLPLTITFYGTPANTNCTVSQSLSDDGADLCVNSPMMFGEDCDVYLGGIYVNIAFVNLSTTSNPNVQRGLDVLGVGNISEVGLLHITVGGTNRSALDNLNFFPNLKAIIGAPNPNPVNAFTGAALYVSGNAVASISTAPSLGNLTEIGGDTILQNLKLPDLTGLESLQKVDGDLVIQNNAQLKSIQGLAQSLENVHGQLYIANNNAMVSLSGNSTTSGIGAISYVGGAITIGGNPNLTTLAGLESLRQVGGAVTITQNNMLSNISALAGYANCASNPTNQSVPVPIFVQVMSLVQPGAPPISCIMNNFVALCAYIKNGGCPNPDGSSALNVFG